MRTRRRLIRTVLTGLLAFTLSPSSVTAQHDSRGDRPDRGRSSATAGPFTLVQARRGADLAQRCTACHGFDFEGDEAPPLIGPAFVMRWSGRTLGDLVARVMATQPASLERTGEAPLPALTSGQAVDVLAFFLLSNGYAAGPRELPADIERLNAIRFTAPPRRQ
mgnify:CR=1 FL=1